MQRNGIDSEPGESVDRFVPDERQRRARLDQPFASEHYVLRIDKAAIASNEPRRVGNESARDDTHRRGHYGLPPPFQPQPPNVLPPVRSGESRSKIALGCLRTRDDE